MKYLYATNYFCFMNTSTTTLQNGNETNNKNSLDLTVLGTLRGCGSLCIAALSVEVGISQGALVRRTVSGVGCALRSHTHTHTHVCTAVDRTR